MKSKSSIHDSHLRSQSNIQGAAKDTKNSECTPIAQPWTHTRTSSSNSSLSCKSTPRRASKLVAEHASAVMQNRQDKQLPDLAQVREPLSLPRQKRRAAQIGSGSISRGGRSPKSYPFSAAPKPKGPEPFNEKQTLHTQAVSGKENLNPTLESHQTDCKPAPTSGLAGLANGTNSDSAQQAPSKLWLKRYGKARPAGDVPPPPALLRVPYMPRSPSAVKPCVHG